MQRYEQAKIVNNFIKENNLRMLFHWKTQNKLKDIAGHIFPNHIKRPLTRVENSKAVIISLPLNIDFRHIQA